MPVEHFKSKEAYRKWTAYRHMHGIAAPNLKEVVIGKDGERHKVKHSAFGKSMRKHRKKHERMARS